MTFNYKVGDKYKTRGGSVVVVDEVVNGSGYSFVDGLYREKNGMVYPNSGEDESDFVCLYEDIVNNPSHYKTVSIECIDAIQAQLTPEEFRGFLKGNIAKYLWREKGKQGKISLEKAQWYLNKLLEVYNG